MFEVAPRSPFTPEGHRRHLREGRVQETRQGGPATSPAVHGGLGGEFGQKYLTWKVFLNLLTLKTYILYL